MFMVFSQRVGLHLDLYRACATDHVLQPVGIEADLAACSGGVSGMRQLHRAEAIACGIWTPDAVQRMRGTTQRPRGLDDGARRHTGREGPQMRGRSANAITTKSRNTACLQSTRTEASNGISRSRARPRPQRGLNADCRWPMRLHARKRSQPHEYSDRDP